MMKSQNEWSQLKKVIVGVSDWATVPEIDLSVSKKIGAVVWTAKYADFSQGDVASFKDTTKFWLMADWSF